MRLFDSHTHLNDKPFRGHVQHYVDHAHKLGVHKMCIAGSNEQMNDDALKIAHQYPGVYAIIGWHPEELKNYNPDQEAKLKQQLHDPSVVGVGEIGLDYYENQTKHALQKKIFARQIEFAKAMHLPVQIHTRRAFQDTYDILKAEHVEQIGGVIHSFDGNPYWVKKFLSLGMDVSYSGIASFKSAHDVHDAVKMTPLSRMLVETDAPCLAPVPYRGHQNEPANVLYTTEAVARLRDTTPDKIAEPTYENACRLFGIEY
ncbi:MAG: TatD family deoxyribonuclease [Acetilactobacillus jinshanensis]